MGISTHVNGQPPPHVPLADINMGTQEFWARDDSFRDGAFATLRREAPVRFVTEIEF
ncbi:MAG: cytochrome P450, partial [Actinomycetota bacterium]|nr:cytochrome P450 [Actinomycetota bacterium]